MTLQLLNSHRFCIDGPIGPTDLMPKSPFPGK
jgi:hypothetical protein